MAAPSEYCPVSIGAELLADRWTMLIVREVMVGSHRFNQIHRGLPGLSRTLLSSRLRHLERIGILERHPVEQGQPAHEYHLTTAGAELEELIYGLGHWTIRWWFPEPAPEQIDNGMLLWRMRVGVDLAVLPERRVTVQFNFGDGNVEIGWLVIADGAVSVCLREPGFEVDLYVRGTGGACQGSRVSNGSLLE